MNQDVISLINHAQGAYVRCIDNGALEAWPDFFEENCIYKITTADNFAQGLEAGVIFANSRGMLIDRVASLREANVYERHVYRHFLGQPWIISQDAEEVRSETSRCCRIPRLGRGTSLALCLNRTVMEFEHRGDMTAVIGATGRHRYGRRMTTNAAFRRR